jgi:hypothetical protein
MKPLLQRTSGAEVSADSAKTKLKLLSVDSTVGERREGLA